MAVLSGELTKWTTLTCLTTNVTAVKACEQRDMALQFL